MALAKSKISAVSFSRALQSFSRQTIWYSVSENTNLPHVDGIQCVFRNHHSSRQYNSLVKRQVGWASSPHNTIKGIEEPLCCNIKLPVVMKVRHQMAKPKEEETRQRSGQSGSVAKRKSKSFSEVTVGQKVKQAGKDATYAGVVIAGIGVTGVMAFAIGRELLSSQSPSGVYGKALKRCRQSDEICVALGEPIKGYGEMNRRGRRRHVSHTVFMANDVEHMRLKFYLEGPAKKGTAHLEVKKNESGKYDYRYLFVEVEDYPPRTIILEDNR